ncbi:SDR family oxidoreductase [Dinghuibacter silviterrae]|uniref:NAD(P)-dependent dehydrogenase (Short-subunit alcohol dehydrogenase family) n=1 Tax=Dinghuibacter silviterrae TaxID=1539049 RepID=A0A4R8DVA8_9BACT|nr:SDR family oxidoreductase [Dinghuibacter silviterrae]TDX01347.1 NAD(P)-dependent dehydrogenase (short-subunit alcohol dehydrogenase family) [Dinghuibacter silviterrae]
MTYQQPFTDEWGIILGGSSGFGLATLEKLAASGMNVAVLYRETAAADRKIREKLDKLSTEHQVELLPYNTNALDEESRRGFIRTFAAERGGRAVVRLLLHSIARGNLKPLVTGDGENVLSHEDLAVTTYAMSTSLLDWTRDLVHEGLFVPEGRVIGLTSGGAHRYWDGYGAVSMAKSSLESLSIYMAVEFAKYGLRTNLIQAGITATPSLERIPGSEQLLEHAARRNPLGRMTGTADVANAIYLLCTKEAAWINGALLHVDGGEHCL